MVLQWDRNGCGSASTSNYYFPFCQPVTGWAKRWPGANIPLTAVRITEAHHKCEVNNHLFQICSMLHEGNKHCREFNTSGQEWTFFEQWIQNHNPASVPEMRLKRIHYTPNDKLHTYNWNDQCNVKITWELMVKNPKQNRIWYRTVMTTYSHI